MGDKTNQPTYTNDTVPVKASKTPKGVAMAPLLTALLAPPTPAPPRIPKQLLPYD